MATVAQIESIPDAVSAQFLRDMREAEPEAPKVELVLEKSRKYLFRTRAGTIDNLRLWIPGPSHKEEMDDKLGPKIARVYERKYGAEKVTYFRELRDRIGGPVIEFRRAAPGKGCYFQTDDPVVAEYVRTQIATGEHDGLYEDYSTSQLRSKYTDQLFPNTEAGRIALGAHDLQIELAAQKLRDEDAALDAATQPDAASARVAAVKKV